MDFLYSYILFGLALPTLIVVLLLVLASFLSKCFSQKGYSTAIRLAPLVAWLALFLYSLVFLSSGYRYPICAVLQQNGEKYSTIGYVEYIADAPLLPLYYNSNSRTFSSGKILTVSGNRLYIPYGDIKVGDAIEIIWGSDEATAYRYSIRTNISETEVGTNTISEHTPTPTDTKRYISARYVVAISFLTFAIFVLLQYPIGKLLSTYLSKEDQNTIGRIVPHKLGVYSFIFMLAPFSGIITGFMLASFGGILLVILPILCIWTVSFIKKLNTHLTIEQNTIIFRECKSIRKFNAKDIKNVYFRSSRFPHNRCLVIVFTNGIKLEFDQLDFFGLDSTYRILSTGQGDGVVS